MLSSARIVSFGLIAFATAASLDAQVLRYADLNTAQLSALERSRTLVIVPGGMIEEHGPYLPAYTDGILSERLTVEVAAAVVAQRPGWTVLVLPQVPLGASGSNELGAHYMFPGTISVRPSTLRTVFMDLGDELATQGFTRVAIVHVHGAPLHNRALDDASDYFRDTYKGRMVHLWGLVPVLQGWGRALGALSDAEKQEEGVSLHAGMDETSLILHLRPELVDSGYRRARRVTGATLQASFDTSRSREWPGYLGSPRLASADMGRRIWESFRAAAVAQLMQMLDEAQPAPVQRYGDLLATIPLYQGWIAGATVEEARRVNRQDAWLASRPRPASFSLPVPTGPSRVGTTAFIVEATSRSGPATVPSRTLVVTAWYPASDTAGRRRAPYLREEAALRQMASYGRNPAMSALLHSDVVTNAWVEAPVARASGRLTVLLFSHGYLAMPGDYTALMEDLASHGFAVFSIAHVGESMAVSLPAGRVETIFGPGNQLASIPASVLSEWNDEDSVAAVVTSTGDRARQEATLRAYVARIPNSTATVERWVGDTRLVMDDLERRAAGGSGAMFAGLLDLGKVGAIGHSMGGVTAAAYCARDRRCGAAVNLDGSPQYGNLIDRPSSKPFLMVYAARPGRAGVSDAIYRKGRSYWRADVDSTLHLNFGDWQYWSGPARIGAALGPIAPARSTEIVTTLVREFFSEQLRGAPSALLRGTRRYPALRVERLAAP